MYNIYETRCTMPETKAHTITYTHRRVNAGNVSFIPLLKCRKTQNKIVTVCCCCLYQFAYGKKAALSMSAKCKFIALHGSPYEIRPIRDALYVELMMLIRASSGSIYHHYILFFLSFFTLESGCCGCSLES